MLVTLCKFMHPPKIESNVHKTFLSISNHPARQEKYSFMGNGILPKIIKLTLLLCLRLFAISVDPAQDDALLNLYFLSKYKHLNFSYTLQS